MPGSTTTPDLRSARDDALQRVAFRHHKDVGVRHHGLFVARWLAYTLPYRRFACSLADADARLGADVGRYSFIVSDLHRLLLAGLPAHYGPPVCKGGFHLAQAIALPGIRLACYIGIVVYEGPSMLSR